MAPIVPDKSRIKSFPDEAAFEAWPAANHAQETELWLRIHKKDSGVPTVTHAQALDVALCWGWIDGIGKSLDESSPSYTECPLVHPKASQSGPLRTWGLPALGEGASVLL
ncbi:hypothetical protein WMF04_10975 [Sorangium sp. So ce260]|uniref:YdeI/OmpD-associated family protein n=1 Tax=Sorangium sp. So ce260 TaxID=3133291 RepID=UPI003F62CA7E